ncbi:ATP-binding cassette domain-containing protein [Lonsdalea quercina]|uniref:ATP-binding cassette domain-containing protein n=1 Tax=Lonsdalea quercina TaxID=71657 RepID=UPI0039755B57
MLEVTRLQLAIQGQTKVRGVSFSVAAGESVGLLGASGSGKSLTARALLGALPAGTQVCGSIRLCGEEIAQSPIQRRPAQCRPAAIFQDASTALNPLVTVEKQLRMAMHSPYLSPQPLRALLLSVGFDDPDVMLSRYPGELSGGQRQRICLALALLCQRPLLIADEPTTALDVISQAQVLNTLQAYSRDNSDSALLFITHDIAVAAALCHRLLVMMDGQIVEQGDTRTLLNHPRHAYTRALVNAARQQHPMVAIPSPPALQWAS